MTRWECEDELPPGDDPLHGYEVGEEVVVQLPGDSRWWFASVERVGDGLVFIQEYDMDEPMGAEFPSGPIWAVNDPARIRRVDW